MARARPQYPRRLAVGCAILASMIGAVVYSLYCPVDALTYIVLAYGSATLPSIVVSLLFAHRLWRW
ncbi:Protein of unknown function [Aquisalimonas asiatica]|uniref:Uncharacterized protein n=1 Tax=Aquisalimonas asiatica TaxID=406100 RepID=A0A1H8VTI7_9GAMM|nr:Protein of unknown function [Aquisalimonas asiatica]